MLSQKFFQKFFVKKTTIFFQRSTPVLRLIHQAELIPVTSALAKSCRYITSCKRFLVVCVLSSRYIRQPYLELSTVQKLFF